MSHRQTVIINTVSQIIGKAVSGATSFLTSIILARSLGVNGYGDFTKVTTYVSFFYLFCDFGLNASYLQLSARDKTQTFRHSLFTFRVLLGMFLMFLTTLLLIILPNNGSQGYSDIVKIGIILFIPSIFFQSLITTANVFFQEHMRYDFATYALIIGSFTSLAAVWFVSYILPTSSLLYGFIGANILGIGVTATSAVILSKKITGTLSFSWHPKEMKELLLTALPLGLTLVFNVVYFHADSAILAISRPTREVGVYGLAYKFFEFTLVIPTFFMNASLPLLIEAHIKNNSKLFAIRIKKSLLALLGLSLGITCLGYFAAPYLQLIRLEFSASAKPLQILLLGLPFFYVSNVSMWVLVVKKLHKPLLYIYGISMIINILANVLCIPTYGYMAAAWITIVSEFLVVVISFLFIVALDKNQHS